MSTLASQHRFNRGFTLIEMMVVMFIVGIAASMAAVSIGTGTRPQEVKNSVRHLYNSINLAFEEAVYQNQQFGLRFDVNLENEEPVYVYQWLVFDAQQKRWFLSNVEELKQQKLLEGMLLEVEVEGQNLIIGSQEKEAEDIVFKVKKKKGEEYEIHPDIYFFSSGETQNFTIRIADENDPDSFFRIIGNMLGQLTFKRPDEDD